jgi:hypothetical protein
LGAVIRIDRIVLHPVDFKPRKFEQYTAEELRRLVEQRQAEQVASDVTINVKPCLPDD